MTRNVKYGLPSMLLLLMFSWAILIAQNVWDANHTFVFNSMEVVRVKEVLYLSLDRTVKNNLIGGFYITLRGPSKSCTAAKPHDLIEKRDGAFITSFLPRFNKECISHLAPGEHSVDVTYEVEKRFFTKKTSVSLITKDITK